MSGGRKREGYRRVIRALMGPYGPRHRLHALRVAAETHERSLHRDMLIAQERGDGADRDGEPA